MKDKINLVTFIKYGTKSYVYYNDSAPNIFYLDYHDCKQKKNPITDTFEINKISQALDEYFNTVNSPLT